MRSPALLWSAPDLDVAPLYRRSCLADIVIAQLPPEKILSQIFPDRWRVNHRLRFDVNVADLHVLRHVSPVGLYRRARLLLCHTRK